MNLKIAENIKRLRSENNLTQAELAECLSVSPQAISRWETGQAYPDIELLVKISDYFNITVDDLMGLEETATNNLTKKYNSLYKQYYKDGAQNDNMLMQLCDILEKLCVNDPLKYSAVYFKLSKKLFDITYTEHLENARKTVLSLFPDTDAQRLNSILMNVVIREDESELNRWKKHISSNASLSTWNDILLHRYSANHDSDKWEKTRQEIAYSHIVNLLYTLTNGMPLENEMIDYYQPPATIPIEHCKLALHTLSLYSNNTFDVFFPVRFHIESKLIFAYFKEGNFEAGFDHLEVLKKYAAKLRQMLDEGTVRRGSVPMLSLVERKTEDFEESVVNEFLLCKNRPIFKEVKNDERFVSALQEFKTLFRGDNFESKLHRKIDCVNKLLRDVLKNAIQDLSEEIQERLLEHYELFANNTVGLRKIEAIRDPQKHNMPKANINDFVKQVYVKMPNRKNDLIFKVTVKYGYLRSIISSECEENLPNYIERYEIVNDRPTTHPSYVPEDWKFADIVRKKSYHNKICETNQDILIVMLSAKENIYTAHFSTINEAVNVNLLDSNLKSLVNDMKSKDDTEIKRLVCFLGGEIDLPAYAFRDKLCRINSANLNTQILIRGLDDLIVKPLSATMAKGYNESFSFENTII